MMDLRWTFLVVRSGKPPARSKRICQPNVDSVPVPVRSDFPCPRSSTWRMRSRYCFIVVAAAGRWRNHSLLFRRGGRAPGARRDRTPGPDHRRGEPAVGDGDSPLRQIVIEQPREPAADEAALLAPRRPKKVLPARQGAGDAEQGLGGNERYRSEMEHSERAVADPVPAPRSGDDQGKATDDEQHEQDVQGEDGVGEPCRRHIPPACHSGRGRGQTVTTLSPIAFALLLIASSRQRMPSTLVASAIAR